MLSEAHVKCDECDWVQNIEPEKILCWHNKLCPQCGKGVIVNDQEAALFRKLLVISKVSDFLGKVYMFFTGKNAELIKSHIDSSVLRKVKPNG
jgi:predicted RNA-binding Zn-ribbon protein involved in translation (DUF1610 family)